MKQVGIMLIIVFLIIASCQAPEKNPSDMESPPPQKIITVASWYDYEINGRPWSIEHATCASRDFPRRTILIVTNIANGKNITCRVNDYIEHPERGIDLSSYAFSRIANLEKGLIMVKIEEAIKPASRRKYATI